MMSVTIWREQDSGMYFVKRPGWTGYLHIGIDPEEWKLLGLPRLRKGRRTTGVIKLRHNGFSLTVEPKK